jgi:2,3,4,5-tetrahydropyridine-2-carboxylate N-succinyltransferase
MDSRHDVLVSPLPAAVEDLWERRGQLTPEDTEARAAIVAAVDALDAGEARVAWPDPATGEIVVDERAKRAILLAFRVLPMREDQVGGFRSHDRIPLKTRLDGVRVVPGAIARWGAYIAPGAVLMPSFVNIGGYVDSGTMVDTWATVGSCAQIGKNVHLSGGVGIGGVLEPPNAVPVVVEDDAFIGSRSMLVEGARVRQGAKLGSGTMLTATTHVIDVQTGEELPRGEAPAWSVCVSGTRTKSFPGGDFGQPCVLVLARLAEGSEHDKLALNDILRDHGVNG